ncbi:MAG: BrnA antitoxin family protein [Oxalobacter sp.]
MQKKTASSPWFTEKSVKAQTAIRFDADVVEAFWATGKGWQTHVNDVMHEWVSKHAV